MGHKDGDRLNTDHNAGGAAPYSIASFWPAFREELPARPRFCAADSPQPPIASYSSLKKNASSPKAGCNSLSQVASVSYLAKNGRCTQSALRPWIKRRTKAFSPCSSTTPCTSTLPGPALIEGPRTVRARPDTC